MNIDLVVIKCLQCFVKYYCLTHGMDMKVHIHLVVHNVDFSTKDYSTSATLETLIPHWIQHILQLYSKTVHKMEMGPLWTISTLHLQILLITTTSKIFLTIKAFSNQIKNYLPLLVLRQSPLLTTLLATKQLSSKPLLSQWLIWVILTH